MYHLVLHISQLILCMSIINCAQYPPSFVSQPKKNTVFYKNEALILHCKATGNPTPTYKWYRYDKFFNYAINDGRYAVWPNEGTLILAFPSDDDDGLYYCTAENSRGIAVSVTSNVRKAEIQNFVSKDVRRVRKFEGQSVKLGCQIPVCFPPPIVAWEKKKNNVIELLKNSNKYVMDIDGNLYITRLTNKEDNGADFTCTAFNQRMRTRKSDKPYQISIEASGQANQKVAEMFRSVRNTLGLVGGKLELICILSGNPIVNYRWFKHGFSGSILDRPNIRLEAGGPILIIQPVTDLDKGVYQCIGDNDESDKPHIVEYQVDIVSAPRLNAPLKDINVPINGSVRITCEAQGIPAPNIIWKVNGGPLGNYLDGVRKKREGNTIILMNLDEKDRAVFQCNATNQYGYDLSNGYVNVLQDKPEFINAPEAKITRAERTNIVMKCETFSAPRAVVSWSKDGYPISGGRYIVNIETGNLHINGLITADTGKFTCLAKNQFGSVSGDTELFVRQRTEIMVRPINTWVYFNQEVKFVCTAKTDRLETENLRIVWYMDNKEINYEDNARVRTNLQDNSLIIMGAETTDNGVYTCNATNGLDYDVAYASLMIQGKPFNPSQISADCQTLASQKIAKVMWISGADNYAPIIEYIVEYSTQYDRKTWYAVEKVNPAGLSGQAEEMFGDSVSVNVRMRPHIEYQFQVRARNRVGISEPSGFTTTKCSIPREIPSQNPTDLFVYGTARDNLVIQWTPMPYIEHNGANLGYEISVKCLDCDQIPNFKDNTSFVSDWNDNILIYKGSFMLGVKGYEMESYKKFMVTIKAKNEVGYCKALPKNATGYSGDSSPTGKMKPAGFKLDGTGRGFLMLSWMVPLEADIKSDLNGFFRGFRAEWCMADLSEEQCNSTRQFQDFIMGVPNIPVLFSSRRKRSVSLDMSRSLDSEAAAAAILSEDHKKQSNGGLRAPVPRNSALNSFSSEVLQRRQRSVRMYTPQDWNFGTRTKVKMTMIPGVKNINVWVRILNTLYAGPRSKVLPITTHEDTPGPVANFRLEKLGINHVEMGWDMPRDTNGVITGFRLGWREIKGLELGYMTTYPDVLDPNLKQYNMAGLQSKTNYRILIWALTNQGAGVDNFIDLFTMDANIAPNAPFFSITNILLNKINISFLPNDKGVKGSVFFAQYRKFGQYSWDESEPQYIRTWVFLDNLANDTDYQVRMVATNGAGMVTPSELKNVHTGGRLDPTRPVKGNAIWIICVVLLLILTAILIIVIIIMRDSRLEKIQGGPVQPMFDNGRGTEDVRPIYQGSVLSGTGSQPLIPDPEQDYMRQPALDEDEEFESEQPPISPTAVEEESTRVSSVSPEEPDGSAALSPGVEFSDKPRRAHRKKKHRSKKRDEPPAEVNEDEDDAII